MSKLNGVCWNAATPNLPISVQGCSSAAQETLVGHARYPLHTTPTDSAHCTDIGHKTRQYSLTLSTGSPSRGSPLHGDYSGPCFFGDKIEETGRTRPRQAHHAHPSRRRPFLTSDEMRNPFVAPASPDSPDMSEQFEMLPYPCRGPSPLRQAPRDLRPRLTSTSTLTLALATLSPHDDDSDDNQKARDIRAWRSEIQATETPGSVRQGSCNSTSRRPLRDSTVPLSRLRSPSVSSSSSSSSSEGSGGTLSRPPAAKRIKDCAILWRQYWD